MRLVDLRETPLDVAEVLAALDDDGSGGLTLFVGRVRDHDHGLERARRWSTPPTRPRSTRCGGCAPTSPSSTTCTRVAAVHRVGRLAIGDIAVIVATTSAHRGTSFDASRALIDTLKAEVPIWKHQQFADGTEEWVGTP